MRFRYLGLLLLVGSLSTPLVTAGCNARASYEVYDPYYGDYHTWDATEVSFYSQWETQTHRSHVDYNKRSDADKKEYWTWRHNQPDHGNGHQGNGNGH